MMTIEQVAGAITANRESFAIAFLQAQSGFSWDKQVSFYIVTQEVNIADAFLEALQYAQNKSFLDILIDILIQGRMENGSLKRAAAEQAVQSGRSAPLQAMINEALGFAQPDVLAKGLDNGIRWTGKINIDNNFKGTGILVAPHLMLTAWHVVSSLFTLDAGAWTPDPGGGAHIIVEFDDYNISAANNLRPHRIQQVGAHEKWCALFSKCHEDELNNRLPEDLSKLEGLWDYVVIRLAKAVGVERTWASPDANVVVPRKDEELILFQHPGGQPMKIGRNFLCLTEPPDYQTIPRLRFLHTANTLSGSSGGPCFDKNFRLFGLHQGEWVNQSINGLKANRGVPMSMILDDARKQGGFPLPDPSEIPIWQMETDNITEPVIGADAFQTIAWDCAINGKRKMINITGNPGTGKTFFAELLVYMLSNPGNLHIILSAEVISKIDVLKLAEKICTIAGAPAPDFSSVTNMDSTTNTWVKNDLVPKVLTSIDSIRNGRLVWISITDLNKFAIAGDQLTEFLLTIYQKLASTDWLRVVLDGVKPALPENILRMMAPARTAEITEADIETFFRRFFADMRKNIDEDVIKATVRECIRKYNRWLAEDSTTAMKKLSDEVVDKMESYVDQESNPTV